MARVDTTSCREKDIDMKCYVELCQNTERLKLGLCNKHYLRLRRTGDPSITKYDFKRTIVCKTEHCEIPLNADSVSLIDHTDHSTAQQYNWSCDPFGYVYNNTSKKLYLHRLIMKPQKGLVVDHRNGNKLDNRRCNIRIVTYSENSLNKYPYMEELTPAIS